MAHTIPVMLIHTHSPIRIPYAHGMSSISTLFTRSVQAHAVLRDLLSSKPDALHEFVHNVLDFPLKSATDEKRPFLLCEFNRHGDSYRSPFSNTFSPPLSAEEASIQQPPDALRGLEIQINEVWDAYRQMYYGTESIGSVYLREGDKAAFLGCFLIQKDVTPDEHLSVGKWTSVHTVSVGKVQNGTSTYKVHSTVWVCMDPSDVSAATSIGARLQKDMEETHKVAGENENASHLANIGKMIEHIEIELRSNLDAIHIPKTKEVFENIRQEPMSKAPALVMTMPPAAMMAKMKKPADGGTTGTGRPKGVPPGAIPMGGPMGAHAALLSQAVLKRGKKG